MKTIKDVYGNSVEITANMVFISATDKFLSGWGCAEGKIHKQVVICENWDIADRVARNMVGNGYKYVNSRKTLPAYPQSRYSCSYRLASDCPLWTK